MIEFKNVGSSYGKKKVLESVSLTVENGEITVIVGKNGSGKTTLFRILTGLLRYSGSVRIDGCEVNRVTASERGRMLAIMPQQLEKPSVTVRELVSYGRQPYLGFSGILSKADNAEVERAMAKTNIEIFADTPTDKISGGELQRAYLAMIMAQCTQNVALDEPCAHLDPQYERLAADFLRDAANSGKAVLAIYHNLNAAIEIANKIAVLDKGELIFTGTAEEFSSSELPETLFSLRRYDTSDDNGKKRVFFA